MNTNINSRRFLSSVMTAAVVAVVLSACTNQDDSANSSSDDAKGGTVHIMMNEHAAYPINTEKQKIFQWIKDATGITIEIEAVPGANYSEKKNTLLATNTMPDVMMVDQNDLVNYGPKGAFVDLLDYMDKMPNFKDHYDSIPDLKYLTVEGSLYALPKLCTGELYGGSVPMIRTDILAELGLEAPTNLEELYAVLKAMKEAYPDSYPWVGRGLDSVLNGIAQCFGAYQDMQYNFSTERWEYGTILPEMREALEYLNRLYAEGILDPDFVTNNNQIMSERLNSGKAMFYIDNAGVFADATNAVLAQESPNQKMEMIPFPKKSDGQMYARINNDQELLWGIYAINSGVKDLDPILTLFDWMYSEEGTTMTNWGMEGETYELVNGRPELTETITSITINLDRKAGQPVRLSLHLVPKLQ